MIGMTRRATAILFVASAMAAGAAAAQTAPASGVPTPAVETIRLRGTIDSVSAESLELTTRGGSAVHVLLNGGVRVTHIVKSALETIQPGSYIGSAAAPQADGTLRALEVHIFPPSMRGAGEGNRPWDLGGEGASMTNGTVGSLVSASGRIATVTYGNEEKQILIPEDAPIVAFEPADASALKAGAKVVVVGRPVTDGAVAALSISVGKDGLVPPM
jgi:hypothetical protein